jgi:hypothetical protein
MPLPFPEQPCRITAGQVRTGHVIRGYNTPHKTLEVAYKTVDTFINPEGERLLRVRFSGWLRFMGEPTGEWVELGFGHGFDALMKVVDDVRATPFQDRPRVAGPTHLPLS